MNNELKSILHYVRVWMEEYASTSNFYSDMTGLCAIASGYISDIMHQKEIPHQIAMYDQEGFSHCFILHGNDILDITASQFNDGNIFKFSEIEIREKNNLMKLHFFWEITKTFNDSKELHQYQRLTSWPEEQMAII